MLAQVPTPGTLDAMQPATCRRTGWRPTAALRRVLARGAAGIASGVAAARASPGCACWRAVRARSAPWACSHRPTSHRRACRRSARPRVSARGAGHDLTVAARRRRRRRAGHPRARRGRPYVALHPADRPRQRAAAYGATRESSSSARGGGGAACSATRWSALTAPWAGFRWGPVPLAGQRDPGAAEHGGDSPAPRRRSRAGWSARIARPRPGHGTRVRGHPGVRRPATGCAGSTGGSRPDRPASRHHDPRRAGRWDPPGRRRLDRPRPFRWGRRRRPAVSTSPCGRRPRSPSTHVRRGDRVALRVISGDGPKLGFASGRRSPAPAPGDAGRRASLRARRGLRDAAPAGGAPRGTDGGPCCRRCSATTWAPWPPRSSRRGVPILVLDTLPPDARPACVADDDRVLAELAWRMRLLEREQVPQRLSRTEAARSSPWRGPGTLDDVLRRLDRHASLPRARAR